MKTRDFCVFVEWFLVRAKITLSCLFLLRSCSVSLRASCGSRPEVITVLLTFIRRAFGFTLNFVCLLTVGCFSWVLRMESLDKWIKEKVFQASANILAALWNHTTANPLFAMKGQRHDDSRGRHFLPVRSGLILYSRCRLN